MSVSSSTLASFSAMTDLVLITRLVTYIFNFIVVFNLSGFELSAMTAVSNLVKMYEMFEL